MRWIITIVLFVSGCAFVDPVWEFRTTRSDAGPGIDAGLDAGPPIDAPITSDAGPTGWDNCRPCTFATDDGCPPGHGCYVRMPGSTSECTVCVERTGAQPLGASCDTGPDCMQGLDCIGGRCRTFCDAISECAPDSVCIKLTIDGLTGWCLGADCDPFDATTCTDGGEGCALIYGVLDAQIATVCQPVGTGMPGDLCQMTGCQTGALCLAFAEPRCGSLCRGDADCMTTQACLPTGTLTDQNLGVCVPRCAADADCPAPWLCNAMMVCTPSGM